MQKVAFTMKLKRGCSDEYKRRHENLWPELQSLLKQAGISDYSIFLDETTHVLFAVQKVSGAGNSQDLGIHPVVQRWWAHMADLMETHPDNSPVSQPLREVFRME